MGENGFITLNAPGPPQPLPMPQGAGRMPVPPGMVHQMHLHPQPPPPPPRDILPVDLRLPPTRVSDLSQELVTDNDIRQRCTEFIAFRLEKVIEGGHIDDDEPMKSAWEKAVVSQIPGMSKKDLEKEIRRLDRDTVSLSEKKKSMSPVLQRQLDKVMNDLGRTENEPVNFQWTLEQVDHQLKEVGRGVAMTRERIPLDHRYSNRHKRRSSSTKKDKRKEKKYYERVSVTAYFKRSPREDVNLHVLYEAQQNAKFQALAQRGRQHLVGAPVAMNHPAPFPPAGVAGMPGPGHGQAPPARGAPPAGRVGGVPPGGSGPLPPPPPNLRPVQGQGGQRPGVVVMAQKPGAGRARKQNASHASHSGSESDDSVWSEDESVFSASPTQTTSSDSRTSRSSVLDKHVQRRSRSRHRSQSRNRRRSRSREDIRLFGRDPRNHTRYEQHYNHNNSPRMPAAPPAPAPVIVQTTTPVVDLERVREEAYLDGRNDERAIANRVDDLALEQRPRYLPTRSPPRGLPAPPTGVRLIPSRSARYLEDDLSPLGIDRLSLDDGYEVEYRHYDQLPRRTLEYDDYSDSANSYDFAREMPYDRSGRRASEYMQRREGPRIYLGGDRGRERNPFSPQLRRAHTYDNGRGQRF